MELYKMFPRNKILLEIHSIIQQMEKRQRKFVVSKYVHDS